MLFFYGFGMFWRCLLWFCILHGHGFEGDFSLPPQFCVCGTGLQRNACFLMPIAVSLQRHGSFGIKLVLFLEPSF